MIYATPITKSAPIKGMIAQQTVGYYGTTITNQTVWRVTTAPSPYLIGWNQQQGFILLHGYIYAVERFIRSDISVSLWYVTKRIAGV